MVMCSPKLQTADREQRLYLLVSTEERSRVHTLAIWQNTAFQFGVEISFLQCDIYIYLDYLVKEKTYSHWKLLKGLRIGGSDRDLRLGKTCFQLNINVDFGWADPLQFVWCQQSKYHWHTFYCTQITHRCKRCKRTASRLLLTLWEHCGAPSTHTVSWLTLMWKLDTCVSPPASENEWLNSHALTVIMLVWMKTCIIYTSIHSNEQ